MSMSPQEECESQELQEVHAYLMTTLYADKSLRDSKNAMTEEAYGNAEAKLSGLVLGFSFRFSELGGAEKLLRPARKAIESLRPLMLLKARGRRRNLKLKTLVKNVRAASSTDEAMTAFVKSLTRAGVLDTEWLDLSYLRSFRIRSVWFDEE